MIDMFVVGFQLLMSAAGGSSTPTTVTTSCCESGRPIMTDPNTGQTVCSCQYSSSLLSYPRVAGLTDTVYSTAYAAQGYVPFGTDPSAFYSPLVSLLPVPLSSSAATAQCRPCVGLRPRARPTSRTLHAEVRV